MRVDAVELEQIKDGLEQSGQRYTAPNLEGAVLDCDHALYEGGFRRPVVRTSTERGAMVIYRSHPLWEAATTDQIVSRLETVWTRHGAFEHEAHSVNVSGDRVLFDLVTWWDDGTFYTGRIEVEPPPEALGEERPAVRPKP